MAFTLRLLVVVAADGKNIYIVIIESVNHTVLLRNPPRPEARKAVLQLFWLADAGCRVGSKHFLKYFAKRFVQFPVSVTELLISSPGVAFKDQ